MEIWLKQGDRRLRIPVLPSSYQVSTSQNNTTVNINGLGEINLLGKRGLATVGFSSFFPYRYQSFCETSIKRPKEYIRLLEKMKRNGAMKLHITGIVSMNVTIESLDYEENDGTKDITYTLNMREYRYLSIPQSTLKSQSQSQETVTIRDSPVPKASGKTHTIIKGESLISIARKETGSADWEAIYEANKSIIGSNPNKIYPGQVLLIP